MCPSPSRPASSPKTSTNSRWAEFLRGRDVLRPAFEAEHSCSQPACCGSCCGPLSLNLCASCRPSNLKTGRRSSSKTMASPSMCGAVWSQAPWCSCGGRAQRARPRPGWRWWTGCGQVACLGWRGPEQPGVGHTELKRPKLAMDPPCRLLPGSCHTPPTRRPRHRCFGRRRGCMWVSHGSTAPTTLRYGRRSRRQACRATTRAWCGAACRLFGWHAALHTSRLLLLRLPRTAAAVRAPVPSLPQLLLSNSSDTTDAKYIRHPATAWFLRPGDDVPTIRCGKETTRWAGRRGGGRAQGRAMRLVWCTTRGRLHAACGGATPWPMPMLPPRWPQAHTACTRFPGAGRV